MRATEFQRWLADFFGSYYRWRPVNATFVGVHEHDHDLPDWSVGGMDGLHAEMSALLRAAERIDEAALTPIERIDKRVATGFLRIQQWELDSPTFQLRNPSLWVGEVAFGVIGVLLTDYAPFAERLEAAIARLEAIPDFLRVGAQVVARPPVAWVDKAREECRGAQLLIEKGLDALPLNGSTQAARFESARKAAARAIASFSTHLRKTYVDAANQVAAGEEALALYMRQGHFLAQSPNEVADYAAEQLALAREERDRRAAALGLAGWQEGLQQLAEIHPQPAGYLARYQELWDASRAHAQEHDLLTWPDFPIRYVERPQWTREAAPHLYFLFYRAPAAFHRPPVHEYLVAPLPREQRTSFLRSLNDSVIKLNHVVHHGGIGHHVQNWNAYRSPSRTGQVAAVDCASRIALFSGGTMAEGWACYATTLMQETGFLTALEELSEAHGRIRMAARAIVDVRLHQGHMTLDEASRFYQEQASMPEAAARSEAIKNSMFPGAALMYLIGHDAILDLRREMQQLQGDAFSLRRFHDSFLSYGSVPVSLIAREMRREAADAAAAE